MNPEYGPNVESLREPDDFRIAMEGFDFDNAFQESLHGIATDAELALDEKIRRMEMVVTEGTSEVYRNFVDFRAIAAQIEMFCAHDHDLAQSVQRSDTLSGFLGGADDERHIFGQSPDTAETKTKRKKKSKKRVMGWRGVMRDAD